MEPALHSKIPTQAKAAVVERPLPSKTTRCWKCQETLSEVPSPVCPKCKSVQEADTSLSYFRVFSLKPHLLLDLAALQDRFYALSKLTHPDLFATHPHPEPYFASRWNALVNKAYGTLKDPLARTKYLLELSGFTSTNKKSVPVELAEAYFELQESLESGNTKSMTSFQESLREKRAAMDVSWLDLAAKWDETQSPSLLAQLEEHLNARRYVDSMLSDIEKRRSHS